jgi:hypothetical protein
MLAHVHDAEIEISEAANRSAVAVRSREGVNAFSLGLEVPQLLLAQANGVIE